MEEEKKEEIAETEMEQEWEQEWEGDTVCLYHLLFLSPPISMMKAAVTLTTTPIMSIVIRIMIRIMMRILLTFIFLPRRIAMPIMKLIRAAAATKIMLTTISLIAVQQIIVL